MNLKQYIFDYIHGHNKAREPRFPHFDQPLSVLVLYESDMLEHNDSIKSIQQDLRRRGMNVTAWGYVAKKAKEITSPILPQSRIVGPDDYNLLGKPKQDLIDDLRATRYNLLLDLTNHEMLPLRYLAMYADADFKAGLNLGEDVHDMLIAPPNLDTEQARPEVQWLYDTLIQYISTIKSKD